MPGPDSEPGNPARRPNPLHTATGIWFRVGTRKLATVSKTLDAGPDPENRLTDDVRQLNIDFKAVKQSDKTPKAKKTPIQTVA